MIDSRILEVEKSCQKLNTACNTRTIRRTMARARFEGAGGLPSGFLLGFIARYGNRRVTRREREDLERKSRETKCKRSGRGQRDHCSIDGQ